MSDDRCAGDRGSYDPKWALVLDEPAPKHGSEVADRLVMTTAEQCSDLDQETVRIRPSGRVLRLQGEEKTMAKRREKRERRSVVLEPDAAGIDIGADEIYVAEPPDRDEESTRRFSSFTGDLHALADWLGRCRIRSVAMESTGVYWIPLFQILEERGFKVYLVNAHYLKSVPGRKSDVSDCEWIQYLHSVGLLRASFRPPRRSVPFAPCGGTVAACWRWLRSTFCICRRRSAGNGRSGVVLASSCPQLYRMYRNAPKRPLQLSLFSV